MNKLVEHRKYINGRTEKNHSFLFTRIDDPRIRKKPDKKSAIGEQPPSNDSQTLQRAQHRYKQPRHSRLSAPGIPRTVILLNLHINQRILIIPNPLSRKKEREEAEERRVAEGKEWRTAVEKSGGKRETTAKTEKVNDKGLDKMKRDRRNISKRDR